MAHPPTFPILPSYRPSKWIHKTCPECHSQMEFQAPGPDHPLLQPIWNEFTPEEQTSLNFSLKCWQCHHTVQISSLQTSPPPYPPRNDPRNISSPKSTSSSKKSNNIGKAAGQPVDTEYYDILNVSPDATSSEIRKSYYALAMRYHPDKCKDDPQAEEKFKKISDAYQVLSEPVLRKQYDEFGGKTSPEGGFMDPTEFFRQQFGGDRFVNIIGDISIAQEFKEAMSRDRNETLTPEERLKREHENSEEKQKKREERVQRLVDHLLRKLCIWTESDMSKESTMNFQQLIAMEAEELKQESYGVELLNAIGYTYSSKAKQYLGGLGGYWHSITEKTHIVSETVSALKSAVQMQKSFHTLADAEKKGLTPEEKVKLEAATMAKGLETLWKGSKMDVESVLRDVCDAILGDKTKSKKEIQKRALALKMVGFIYLNVKPDPSDATPDNIEN